MIFGHSTLPQLFNPKNYKTIFANAYLLKENDLIYATVENITYKYRVYNISVVDPKDTSIFTQDLNDSYITLVTCTPPGTIWKRLIIKARLEKNLMEEENRFKTILIKIWPAIYRIINGFLYFLLTLVRAIIKIAVNQLKGGGV